MTTAGTADAMLPPRHRSLVQRAMELLRSREWHQSVATAASRWQSGSSERRQTLSTPSRCEEPSSEARSVSGSERQRAWCTVVERGERGSARMGKRSEVTEAKAAAAKAAARARERVRVARTRSEMPWLRRVWCGCAKALRGCTLRRSSASESNTARGVGPKQRKSELLFFKFPCFEAGARDFSFALSPVS